MSAATHPDQILKDLEQLWVSLGKEEAGGVLRACAMTLIAATEENAEAGAISQTLAELMPQHPSRAIVICVRRKEAPSFDAKVTAQCWMPSGGRQQICSEQIELTSSLGSLADLPPVIMALAAPDLPVVLWCRSAAVYRTAEFRELLALAHKCVLDSARFDDIRAFLTEAAELCAVGQVVADLSWTRLTHWREMIAQAFECPQARSHWRDISELEVSYTGAAIPVEAAYMAGWLASALGWEAGDPRLRLQQEGDASGSGLQGVKIVAPGMTIAVEREQDSSVAARINGLLHRSSFRPGREAEAALLGEELSILERDLVYERSLILAARIAAKTP